MFLSMYTFIILTVRLSNSVPAAQKEVNEEMDWDWYTLKHTNIQTDQVRWQSIDLPNWNTYYFLRYVWCNALVFFLHYAETVV